MIHPDITKFKNLLETDSVFQKKLTDASFNYTGEQTEEAIFQNIILPLAKEYDMNLSIEDMQEYSETIKESLEVTSEELAQVSGGAKGGGFGLTTCVYGLGFGAGVTIGSTGGAGCAIVGVGHGAGLCIGNGDAGSLEDVYGN